jgi:uncharacterized protein
MIIEEMTIEDCYGALTHARLGRLACSRENQPYIVPIYFAFEERFLYGFTTPGQKVEWMRSNPLVCVELDEVGDHAKWTSLVIFGRFEELPETDEFEDERSRAHELLQKHAKWWEPGCASRSQYSPEDRLTPLFYRIHIDQISGRRSSRDAIELAGRSCKQLPAEQSGCWLGSRFDTLTARLAGRRRIRRQP